MNCSWPFPNRTLCREKANGLSWSCRQDCRGDCCSGQGAELQRYPTASQAEGRQGDAPALLPYLVSVGEARGGARQVPGAGPGRGALSPALVARRPRGSGAGRGSSLACFPCPCPPPPSVSNDPITNNWGVHLCKTSSWVAAYVTKKAEESRS